MYSERALIPIMCIPVWNTLSFESMNYILHKAPAILEIRDDTSTGAMLNLSLNWPWVRRFSEGTVSISQEEFLTAGDLQAIHARRKMKIDDHLRYVVKTSNTLIRLSSQGPASLDTGKTYQTKLGDITSGPSYPID